MRILLVNQGTLDAAETGLPLAPLSGALAAAGHEVRRLAIDNHDPADAQAFLQLSDPQLAAYRDVLRQALDAEIDAFDPHIVHVQPIWVLAHLALEAGAPYVLTASGVELPVYRLDPRFRRLTEEAAENAGRIIATSEAVRLEMIAAFGDLDGRVVTMPAELAEPLESGAEAVRWLIEIYRRVLIDRFGACPES